MNSASLDSPDAASIERRKNTWSLPPAGIATLYLVVGALWILLSDLVAAAIFPDRQTFASVQTYKGWFFIAFTALLLYILITRTLQTLKHAKGAQAESELRFRTLVEQIPAITYIARPRGGGTTYMSPQAGQVLGYALDEWNSKPDMWHRLLHPSDHERTVQKLEESYRSGKPFRTEYRMQAKDGRTFWFRDEATVVLDEQGEPVRLQGVMVDITERKAIEENLSQERDFTSTVLEITASLVIVLDREGRIIRFNHACEQVSGYSSAEAAGRTMWEFLLLPEEAGAVKEQFARLVKGQMLSEYSNHWVTRRGEVRLIQWSNSVIFDSDNTVKYVVGTGIDITERQANERQLEEQAALQKRLLRELLTAQEAERRRLSMEIHDGPLQLLGVSLLAVDRAMRREERGETEQARHELRSLRETLASTVGEVRSVLADLSLDVLNQYGLVPALKDHARRFSEITGIEVSVDDGVPERLPEDIELMVYRLAQEALSNVRKHANAQQVEIQIKEEGDLLVMSIVDNGKGFDTSTEQSAGLPGERLGLRSMQERVHNARGEFTIVSSPSQGTKLTFSVPYKDA